MATSAQELRAARAKQLQADVLVHEVYAGNSSMSASSFGSSESDFRYIPNESELENYARVLNNPGQIMPHGVVFLLNESNQLNIMASSANCEELFGRHYSEIIGTSALNLFVETQRIETALAMKNLELANPVTLSIRKENEEGIGGTVNVIFHRGKEGIIADVEPLDPSENPFSAHQKVRAAIDRLGNIDSIQKLCEQACEDVFNVLQYDRVMVYKFAEDCHGEVLAERTAEHITDSYLGLHYPATDLPQRIRDQYKTERVRLIVDVKAVNSPIITEDPDMEPHDVTLSGSTLRRAHQCHLEYLENMGVSASIGLAIIVRDHLWGLIIGHHVTPKFLSFQSRMSGDFLCQAYASRIANIEDVEAHQRHESTLELHAKLCDLMVEQGFNPGLRLKGLVTCSPNLTDLVPGMSGAAVYYCGKVTAVGDTPDDATLSQIAAGVQELWMSSSAGRQVQVVERLADLDPAFASFAAKAAGMICVPVLEDGMMLLFRPELATTIRWGGNPNQPAVREKHSGAMHPRGSFDIYTDSVKNKCASWLKWQVDAAVGLGQLVNDIVKSTDESGTDLLGRVADSQDQTKKETLAAMAEMGQLVDSVQAPVFALDPKGSVQQWNHMLASLSGFAKAEVVNTSLSTYLTPTCRPVLDKLLSKVAAGEAAVGLELSIVKSRAAELPPIARKVDLLVNGTARYDAAGVYTGVNCVCQDVTATNLTKNMQHQISAQLEQIAQMTASLQPNAMDATEFNFDFEGDKEDALLGEGAFGKTYKMRSEIDGQLYAVKMINVKKAQKNGLPVEALKREVHMLLRLNNPFIVRYYTCYMRKKGKYFCIVMELVSGGTIGDLIKKGADRQDEDKIRLFLGQVARGLEHIHTKKMLHRDLKPDNVLISTAQDEAKITDFGLACVNSSANAAMRAGTISYASPEKASSKPYDNKDDIWALGCMLAELLTGVPMSLRCAGGVFAFNQLLVARTIAEGKAVSPRLGSILEMMLANDPALRPSAAECALLLESKGLSSADATHLLEEYLCCLCGKLVMDAHCACTNEHLCCFVCLHKHLAASPACPSCAEPAALPPHRLRVMNNVVEKLASKLLSPPELDEREERRKEIAVMEEKLKERAEAEKANKKGSDKGTWKAEQGTAQFGSGCTLMTSTSSGAVLELFHENGWFRFRATSTAEVKWCNSCGIVGESDFGAPDVVAVLDGGGGATMSSECVADLVESQFWVVHMLDNMVVLGNEDGEGLVLLASGGFVWLSHASLDKALVVQSHTEVPMSRGEALASVGEQEAQHILSLIDV
eukprot:CAMPEP_0181298170 /NCGR_PEP_ID=MMETSP1101-20121128/5639_1 /TAXON_ID=46948 /ORGANISM="Rhodomonas abbreviata, Strain Caron Lab Isolate" /LENGTH=1287 /DNA_ID=CAMNT_0023403173 /DNA_START=142 /DNA_END=4001 /DNA_ORIENTATION=+